MVSDEVRFLSELALGQTVTMHAPCYCLESIAFALFEDPTVANGLQFFHVPREPVLFLRAANTMQTDVVHVSRAIQRQELVADETVHMRWRQRQETEFELALLTEGIDRKLSRRGRRNNPIRSFRIRQRSRFGIRVDSRRFRDSIRPDVRVRIR